MKAQDLKSYAPVIISVVVVVLLVVFSKKIFEIFGNITSGIGLTDSPEEKENKKKIDKAVNNSVKLGIKSAWNSSFYKQADSIIFNTKTTDTLVKMLWDSVGYVYDSPGKASAAIGQCKTKAQVSWLAENFYRKYNLNLLQWLSDKFDTESQREYLANMLSYVDKLPNFKP